MENTVVRICNTIDILTPVVDLLDSMSSALRCETFDDATAREGISVALGLGSEKVLAAISLLYAIREHERPTPKG